MSVRDRFFKLESVLYGVGVVGAFVTAYFLFFADSGPSTRSFSKKPLGFVRPMGKDIRLKPSETDLWDSLVRDANVYESDRIYTGASSTAIVKLMEATEFVVRENSLIQITAIQEGTLFDLQTGSFFGQLQKGARIFLKSGDEVFALLADSNSRIRVEKKGRQVLVKVLQGVASVKKGTKGPPVALAVDQEAGLPPLGEVLQMPRGPAVAETHQGRPEPEPPKVLKPEAAQWNRENYFIAARSELIPSPVFQFRLPENSDSDQLEISGHEDFHEARTFPIQGREAIWREPTQGEFFVRIRSENEAGVTYSKPTRLRIVAAPLPPVPAPLPVVSPRKLASMKEEKVVSTAKIQPPEEKFIYRNPQFEFWGGGGGNSLKFDQAGQNDLATSSFEKLSLPNLMLGLNFRLTDSSRFQFEYHSLPGDVVIAGKTKIDRKEYQWQTYGAEYQHRLWGNLKSFYSLLLGAQVHQVPFFDLKTNGTLSLIQNELQNYSVGLKGNYLTSGVYEYEVFLRYQGIIASRSLDGGSFDAQSKMLFDGSLGLVRPLKGGFRLGLFWLGQLQDFSYRYSSGGSTSSGSQSLFQSSIQLRLGYEILQKD